MIRISRSRRAQSYKAAIAGNGRSYFTSQNVPQAKYWNLTSKVAQESLVFYVAKSASRDLQEAEGYTPAVFYVSKRPSSKTPKVDNSISARFTRILRSKVNLLKPPKIGKPYTGRILRVKTCVKQ